MPPPKAGDQIVVPVRLPARTVAEMDARIERKEFGSRSLLIKFALDRFLDADRARAEADQSIREQLLRGAFDEEIEMQVRKVLGQVIIPPNNINRGDEHSPTR